MKITGAEGPGQGAAVDGGQDVGSPEAAEVGFKEALGLEAAGEGSMAQAASPLDRLAGQLQAREVDREQAMDALIDAVLAERGHSLPAGQIEQLRVELRRLLEEDPLLSHQARQLLGG